MRTSQLAMDFDNERGPYVRVGIIETMICSACA